MTVGDFFQRIGDIEVAPEEAEELGAAMVGWLVDTEVIAAGRTECVLGSALGHPPGPRYADAVTEPDPSLAGLWSNGLEVVTGRTVFDGGQDELESATCPHCATTVRLVDDHWQLDDRVWEPFQRAISVWHSGGAGLVGCPACAQAAGLNDWSWRPEWGFGHLGFTFWNWPPLAPEFLAEFARRLGHRVVCPAGKL